MLTSVPLQCSQGRKDQFTNADQDHLVVGVGVIVLSRYYSVSPYIAALPSPLHYTVMPASF